MKILVYMMRHPLEVCCPSSAGTSVLSLERLYMRKQASHDVLYSIGIIQARGLSSSHQSLGDYFEGETPWVLFDFPDQFFPALKSTFLYALTQSWFCFFPCLPQQRITLWAGKTKPRCKAFSTQDRQLFVPPAHRVPGTTVPAARHGVVTCCDHFAPRGSHSVLQRPSRLCPTKLIYEPFSFKMFAKLVFAEIFYVPGGAPYFAAPSRIHCVTPFLDAKLNALVVTRGRTSRLSLRQDESRRSWGR